MTNIAIRVENLSKLYPSAAPGAGHIGRARQRHDTLRDALSDFRLQILDFGRKPPKSKTRSVLGLARRLLRGAARRGGGNLA